MARLGVAQAFVDGAIVRSTGNVDIALPHRLDLKREALDPVVEPVVADSGRCRRDGP